MKHTQITTGRRLVSIFTALLLILAITAAALPQEAWAATGEFEINGLKYKVTDEAGKTVEVTGPADNSITEASIPDTVINNGNNYTVTAIGIEAFYKCADLKSIAIPDSVTAIGTRAFSRCSSLASITGMKGVEVIGWVAFFNCSALVAFAVPDSVTSIEYDTFSGCSSLAEFKVTEKNTAFSVRDGVLFSKNGDTLLLCPAGKGGAYTVPDGVTSIGNSAFFGCSNLTSVTIPGSVESIGNKAFYDCSGLTSVSIPDSVTSIGDGAFSGCSSLQSITIPDSVTSIGNKAFAGCGLQSITIPDSVESIGSSAFVGCGLQSITIPDSVTSIGDYAFQHCSSLVSVTIGDSVESIGRSTFGSCGKLSSVTIGDSVTSIGDQAFDSCRSLTSVSIPDSVTSIGDQAFQHCSSLASLTIPNNVTSTGFAVFAGCKLTSVLVMFDSDPEGQPVSDTITNSTRTNSPAWYRGFFTFDPNVPDAQDLTLDRNGSCSLSESFGMKDLVLYKGKDRETEAGDLSVLFQLSGNTSGDTAIDSQGVLHIGGDEKGPLAIRTGNGKQSRTIHASINQPPAVSYWCTLTADALSFPEMEAGDTLQSQPLQLHCSGNTGASITKVALSGTDFLLDDSKAEAYVSPGKTNTTYRIMPKAGLAPGSYKATVTVTYSYGKTAEADVTLTVTEATQKTPAKLTAKSKNYRTIALSWKKAARAEKYQVYRAAKKNGTYRRIAATSKTSLNNSRLATGKTYYYKVRAYRTVNGKKVYSPFTKIISAVPRPSAPSFSLKAGKYRITASWKGVSGASGYRIYRATAKNGRFVLVKDSRGKARSYTSTGLRSKKTYYYKLRAYRVVNGKKIYSNYTKVKSIKTK